METGEYSVDGKSGPNVLGGGHIDRCHLYFLYMRITYANDINTRKKQTVCVCVYVSGIVGDTVLYM